MKILATVIVLTLCLFVGSSYAADRYDWSGIYGGLRIGYVNGSQDWTLGRSQFWGNKGDKQDFSFNSFDIGGHVGAQYQWKWLVLGAEGSIYKGPYDEQTKKSPRYPTTDQWRADICPVIKAVAKVGYAYDRFLFYGKGGYAGAMVDTEVRYTDDHPEASEWQSGWTVGAGIEYALSKHWIIGAEYSYIDLGTQAHKTTSWFNRTFDAKVDAAMHQVLFGVSYKF